jgi:hypothetical protein
MMVERDDDRLPEDARATPNDDASDDLVYRRVVTRGASSDPLFGVLLSGAISIGLIPLIGAGTSDMRYTITWGLLAGFGVLAWLLGDSARIAEEQPENLAWGLVFGLVVSMPLLAFGVDQLEEATRLLFPQMASGTLLAYLVFVMPLAETLFFRGLLQQGRTFWQVSLIATAWQLVLFFPLINIGPYPLLIGVALLMANAMYSYVRERNGLAAAWLCQITVNVVLFFLPLTSV